MSFHPLIPPVRDLVVTTLNSAAFATPAGSPIIAVAIYDIVFDLAQLTAGRMLVRPADRQDTKFSRGGPESSDVTIDVAIQYKYATPAASELDPYLAMTEKVAAHVAKGGLFLGGTIATSAGPATCMGSKFMDGLYAQKHIEEYRVFTSIVSLTFTLKQ